MLQHARERRQSNRKALPDADVAGLSEEDAGFYRCRPTIMERLEAYLAEHRDQLVLLQ